MAEASTSEIAMFRGIIALAWADHRLSDEEQERLVAYIEHGANLSEAQRDQLIEEIATPIRMVDIWPEITEPRDRAHVLNVADAIFWEDGTLCHDEKEIYDRFKALHMATLDVDGIREDLAALRQELLVERREFQQELVAARGPVGRLLYYVETFVDRFA